jgi:hypothetical protein
MLNRQPSDGSWPANTIGKTRNREKISDVAKANRFMEVPLISQILFAEHGEKAEN